MTTILLAAHEASGDLHGGNLARQLRALDPSVRLVGCGGRHMREAGVEILVDPTAHHAVGLVEVVAGLHRHARTYRLLQSALRTFKPDAAVLIDAPDFNLRFAERVKDHGVPVVYYVSPQIWAWRKGRIRAIRRVVRKMLVILDFEEKLYRDAGVDVTFVGHPLLDAEQDVDRAAFRRELGDPELLVGLLPGSRKKQFGSLYPVMLGAAGRIRKELPGARFVVAAASTLGRPPAASEGVSVVAGRTPEVMAASDLLLVASGTSTLEAAVYGTPMVVTYRLNPVTAYLLGPLVWLNTRDFALVNIVAGRRIVPECYQRKAKPEILAREAVAMVREGRLPQVRRDLAEVRRKLGEPGASRRAAEEVLKAARAR